MIAALPLHRRPARKRLQHIVGTGAIFLSTCASAQLGIPDPTSELQRQDRQRQELRQSLEVPPWSPSRRTLQTPNHQRLPNEQPCVVIRSVTIEGALSSQAMLAALNGIGGDDSPHGRCLGSQGVTLLIQRAQQALVAQGHITSHVHVPEQDLNSGALVLRIHEGRVARIQAKSNDGSLPRWV